MLSPSEVVRILGAAREKQSDLHHCPHQWGVSTLTKLLQDSPTYVEFIDDRGASSIDQFSGKRIKQWLSSVTLERQEGTTATFE